MTEPSVELQAWIVGIVEADATLMGQIAGIYDSIPENPYGVRSTYISFGPEFVDEYTADCLKRQGNVVQLDVWSKAVGRVECKQVCARLKSLIEGTDLQLTTFSGLSPNLVLQRVVGDPQDGVTHGVLQFRFEIETPAWHPQQVSIRA